MEAALDMVQAAVLDAIQHCRGPSWIGLGSAMDRTWMSLGRFLDDLETGGSRGTRTKRELPANDRDPAGNLSFCVRAPTKSFDGAGDGSWGVHKISNVVGDAGRAPVVDSNGT